jgi:RNA polymerase sigma-70 factor (ECF subfamily)
VRRPASPEKRKTPISMNGAIESHRASASGRGSAGSGSQPYRKARRFGNVSRPASGTEASPAVKQRRAENPGMDETIRLAQQGDAEAFETLYRQNCRRVYALCLRMLKDPTEAEDLAQEAFMQLFRKIHTFRGESAFSSWLHRLTANVVLMRFRKKVPPSTSLDDLTRIDEENGAPRMEIGVPDLRLSGLFDRLKLQDAIEQLPEGYRTMLVLHDVHGYEHHEIAALFGCSTGNSKSQLHKARKRLRRLLGGAAHCRAQHGPQIGNGSFALAGS